jgi:hypothetical protein
MCVRCSSFTAEVPGLVGWVDGAARCQEAELVVREGIAVHVRVLG